MPAEPLAADVWDGMADEHIVPLTRAGMQREDERLRVIPLNEFLAMEFPPREMLLGPWLPKQGLAMVFAPRGVGKTHFSLGVAYAVATGGTFLKWTAPEPNRVLVIDGEMPAAALKERWASIVDKSLLEPPSGDYVGVLAADTFVAGLPDLSTKDGQAKIEPLIGDAQLIVVDNLSTLARSGKENESESWGLMQEWALCQRRQGRSVLFIHHAGKGGEQRGTSRREDVMDSVIKLSLPSDYTPEDGARFVVQFTKSRGFAGDEAAAFEAILNDGLWSTKALVDVRTEQIIQLHGEGLSQRDIASELGCGLATVNRTIKKNKGEA
jgi:KaiC/GvpD/RAD55 family RecA-like ATPase